jgi:predicted Zn-dependent peptidase
MSSRLFSELRDKRALAYSTGSFYPSRAEESHLVTYIIALPDNAEAARQGILEIIKEIQERGVPKRSSNAPKATSSATIASSTRRQNRRRVVSGLVRDPWGGLPDGRALPPAHPGRDR